LIDPPQFTRAADGPADVIVWFVRQAAELRSRPSTTTGPG
jgi:hypothetical protein